MKKGPRPHSDSEAMECCGQRQGLLVGWEQPWGFLIQVTVFLPLWLVIGTLFGQYTVVINVFATLKQNIQVV